MRQHADSFFNMLTRRTLLERAACGFGATALSALLADRVLGDGSRGDADRGNSSSTSSGPTVSAIGGKPAAHFPARARRVIFLFMQGGPSQHDLFDFKPLLKEGHGQRVGAAVKERGLTLGVDKYLALGPVAPFGPRGRCGMVLSDLLPHLGGVADELCLLRAMEADNNAHAIATLQLHTGATSDARPSMGSWITYGLGSENGNLPGFLTITPDHDVRTYGAAFLPAAHQGTAITQVPANPKQPAIRHLFDEATNASAQRRQLDFVQKLNRRTQQRVGRDGPMDAMISAFEMAFRMQAETPKLVDLSGETKETLDLYGVGAGPTDRMGRACLLARRLSEAGVRFVQVTLGGWDHHGDLYASIRRNCLEMDQPVAALVKDLRRRGLLDDTLVVWSGEFGRTPWSQDLSGNSPIDKHGREHQPESFCTWLAGGGVKPGFVHGATDDFGYRGVEGKVHLHDLHATMLALLGLDHERLTYRYGGRDFRLTDIAGRVVSEILA